MGINSTDKIGDLLSKHPELYEVLVANGIPGNSIEEVVQNLGKDTMLKTVLKVKGINEEIFMGILNQSLKETSIMNEIEYDFYDSKLPVNLLVKTACPISTRFKDRLMEVIKDHKSKTGKDTNCFFVGGCDAPHEFDDFADRDNIDDLPDIIMSMGFDEIYDKKFIDKFIKTGYFENPLADIKKEYKEIGCHNEYFTLNAGLVIGFLIDEKKLGDLPKPKKWKDLFDEIYKDKLVVFGSETEGVFEYTLYYLYKEFGIEGIRDLAKNTKFVYHGAKMAKVAGSNSRETEAIHIVPLTFSKLCKNKDTSVIVPEDGGYIIPISFLVKKDKLKELDYLVNLLINDYGQMCVDINGISFNPNLVNTISSGVKLNWLGWDFIETNSMLDLGEDLKKEFHKVWDNN